MIKEILKVTPPIDKNLLKKRFGAASSTYGEHAKVQQRMAVRLVEMAQMYLSAKQGRVLEFGCGTGLLTQQIIKHFSVGHYVINDLVGDVSGLVHTILKNRVTKQQFIAGDVECLDLPDALDSIWSGATIQWINQLQPFFYKLSQHLKPGAYLLVSSFGPNNYKEIKATTGNGIAYETKEQLISAASSGFELIAFEEWQEQLWFNSPLEVLKHMRSTGVNGVSACSWTKGKMNAFCNSYSQWAQSDGYPLTYHPYLMVFKKN
ncbi:MULTISPECIES: malonyl-ACP O-methyltransferase BioC [unclassified Carboxylicivirga]|uniref:malonyl-ACP O-methyltransferase BioC n=1 Tax=Carboxylicivirga TaxID=1628153 RepID=UPI003D32FD2C